MGTEIGRDTARFLVYQDDRELENPSADLKLAREIAELTGGEMVSPERLASALERHRPVELHRILEPDRVQGLGQLAVSADLRGALDPRVVGAEAAWVGLRVRYSVELFYEATAGPPGPGTPAGKPATPLTCGKPATGYFSSRSSPAMSFWKSSRWRSAPRSVSFFMCDAFLVAPAYRIAEEFHRCVAVERLLCELLP